MRTALPPLKDRDVRLAIHRQIVPALVGTSPSRVLDEFSLCLGAARIDVAVINGRLHGIEIKSEADTLLRLDRQIEAYSKVFDTVTIVCGQNHLLEVEVRVPKWWGIYVARPCEKETAILEQVRPPGENSNIDPVALAQFLWKEEIVTMLQEAGAKGVSSKPRRKLWPMLAETFSLKQIQENVRRILKTRQDWRPDLQQT